MLNTFEFSLPGDIEAEYKRISAEYEAAHIGNRIWSHDSAVWTSGDEQNWLGWLDIAEEELDSIAKYKQISRDIAGAGFNDIVLLGMGGSSLGPEVFSRTFNRTHFHILDSTVPAQIRALEESIDVARTLFIVASKSGSTLEPNIFKQYFYNRVVEEIGPDEAGSHFLAITDPGSKLESVAESDGFRGIFYGDPSVGGRFSVLSAFGLVPAAVMGLDVAEILELALEMTNACRSSAVAENPGMSLGILLGACHKEGRDKLSIYTTGELSDVGAWMEQLVAESTGKNGVAIIPVDQEPVQEISEYSTDRIFTFLTFGENNTYGTFKTRLARAGHPVVSIGVSDKMRLGQEFFRWEFATAVAGSVMQINPFNQPDVEAAKVEAKKITQAYEESGKLPSEEPFLRADGFELYGDEIIIAGTKAMNAGIAEVVNAHFARIEEGDYFAILAYIQMNAGTRRLLESLRSIVLERHNAATGVGFGPRFLHSTGQAYKGGPNNGVFLQITSDDANDLLVPHHDYTFGIVKAAQSRGDFQVLLDRGRRALRIHIGADVESELERLVQLIGPRQEN